MQTVTVGQLVRVVSADGKRYVLVGTVTQVRGGVVGVYAMGVTNWVRADRCAPIARRAAH